MTGSLDGKRGLFLDLDGTLADSLDVLRTVYDRFLASHACQGSDAEFERLNGPPMTEVVATLGRDHGLTEPVETLVAEYEAMIDEVYGETAAKEGAEELLAAGQARGWTAVVVTGNQASRTCAWLAERGLDSLVTDVVGGGEAARGKPHPEPYLTALARSGCDARLSIAVEDSPKGASAAVAAGLPTYVLEGSDHGGEAWPAVAGFVPRLDSLLERL